MIPVVNHIATAPVTFTLNHLWLIAAAGAVCTAAGLFGTLWHRCAAPGQARGPALTDAQAAMLLEVNTHTLDGLHPRDEHECGTAQALVTRGLAEWALGPCFMPECGCEVPVIRLTDAGVAELPNAMAARPATDVGR